MGFEPATHALRKRCSTPELHRLIDCLKCIINALVAHLTLAIIPFAYSPCQAFFIPREKPHNKVIQQIPFPVTLFKTQ